MPSLPSGNIYFLALLLGVSFCSEPRMGFCGHAVSSLGTL